MILVLDNYDSFTWNIVHYLRELGTSVEVARNDSLRVDEALASGAGGFVVSPGPGTPDDAGISLDLVVAAAETRRPLLGVCLGHQVVGQAFGGEIVRAPTVMHAKTSRVAHDGSGVFAALPSPFDAARYHSLVVDEATLPESLVVAARAEDGTVQALRHRDFPLWGVQFHPESIASEHGYQLLGNFLALTRSQSRA